MIKTKAKWITLLVIYALLGDLAFGHTNSTIISRLKISHPDLGYDGGASLHTAVDNLYIKIGDNINSRYNEYSSVANSTVTTIDHNFGVAFAELQIRLYTGIGTSKVRVTNPTASGWVIAATSGFVTTKVDVTAPSSGGPHTFSVAIIHGRGSEKLDDLDDVDVTSVLPEDGQALVYSSTSGQWSGGASGDSSLKCQSISTPTLVLKSGYLILDDSTELQVASDLSLSLTTILGSSPANATAYYLYVDRDALPVATTLTNGRKVTVLSTASHFSLQTATPDSVLTTRYIPLCVIKSATTGTVWSGSGSAFATLATRRHSRPVLNVNPTVYAPTQQAVGTIGSSSQIVAGHILSSASFPTFTTNLSFYNLTGLTDGSGNARSLTNNGTSLFTATNLFGTASAALTLNGTTQSLSSTSSFFNPGNGSNVAIGGWFKATDWTPTSNSYMVDQNGSGSDNGFGIYVAPSGDIHFYGTNTAGTFDTDLSYPNPGFTNGDWHHFSMVYNFATTRLKGFVDGVQVVSGTLANIRTVTSPVFQIGAVNGTSTLWFGGSAEEVYFTTLAFTDEDVRRTYSYRADHNKNVAVNNQLWDAVFAGNLTASLNRNWLVHMTANSVFWDFSDMASTDQVAVTMANKSFTTTVVPIVTFSTGKLSASPTFPLAHGLGTIPKDFYILTTGQSLSAQDDKRYDLCSADATNITCDVTSLTIDSSHKIEVVASAAPIAVSVPVASGTASGIVSTYTPADNVNTKIISSANYTVLDADGYRYFLITTGASDRTFTLPSVTSLGRPLFIKKVDAGAGKVIVTPASGNIDGATTNSLNAQNSFIEVLPDGTNWTVTRVWDMVEFTSTSDFNQSTPTNNTFYDVTSATIVVSPGLWKLEAQASIITAMTAGAGKVGCAKLAIRTSGGTTKALSGSNDGSYIGAVSAPDTCISFAYVMDNDSITAATTYKLSVKANDVANNSSTFTNLGTRNTDANGYSDKTILRATRQR